MKTTTGATTDDPNAFDVLRLGLALLVLYSHCFVIGGFPWEPIAHFAKGQINIGTWSVLGFFSISGFLISQSFRNRPTVIDFVGARLLRILPGYYTALLLGAFVIAPLIAHQNQQSSGWQFSAAAAYVVKNLAVRVGEWHISGILKGLPFEGSFNGSLWSLYPELQCYAIVLALGLAGALSQHRLFSPIILCLLFSTHVTETLAGPSAPSLQTPTFLQLTHYTPFACAFMAGVCIQIYWTELRAGWRGALLWGVGVLLLLRFGGWSLLGPLVLPMALIQLAHSFSCRLPLDLSYGIYIFHFPLLHLLSAMGVHHLGFPAYLSAGLLLSGLMATLSWFLVERPCLRLKSRLTKSAAKPLEVLEIPHVR